MLSSYVPLSVRHKPVCIETAGQKGAEPIWIAVHGGFLPPIPHTHTHTHLTALFRDYPGEPVPER